MEMIGNLRFAAKEHEPAEKYFDRVLASYRICHNSEPPVHIPQHTHYDRRWLPSKEMDFYVIITGIGIVHHPRRISFLGVERRSIISNRKPPCCCDYSKAD